MLKVAEAKRDGDVRVQWLLAVGLMNSSVSMDLTGPDMMENGSEYRNSEAGNQGSAA